MLVTKLIPLALAAFATAAPTDLDKRAGTTYDDNVRISPSL